MFETKVIKKIAFELLMLLKSAYRNLSASAFYLSLTNL